MQDSYRNNSMAVLWWWSLFLVMSLQVYASSAQGIDIAIRSEGCDDPKKIPVPSSCGYAYIEVNGRDYANKRTGHNIVLVDYQTGRVEESVSYNTYGSISAAYSMTDKLKKWSRERPRKVVLIAIQAEGSRLLYSFVKDAMVLVGAKKPLNHGYKGSYALVGYTGPEKVPWIRQVQNVRGRGPSIIKMKLFPTGVMNTPRPPLTAGPRPPVGSCGVPGAGARVIGGVNAVPGAWPWQVALLRTSDGVFFCGGSLINRDWIVTAAHCISSLSGSYYTILLGAHNRNFPQSHEQRIRGKRVIKHPQYGRPALNNDVALIQLEIPASLNSRISTVCLPQHNDALSLSSTCYITGWGKIKHPGSSHHILQQAKLPPVEQGECQRKLAASPGGNSLSITSQMLCAGKKDTNLSGCHGDSGGPYVCRDSSNRFVLHGVVSWGSARCAASERYTVFARVAKFRSWIDGEIRKTLG